jgi:hypothetical protein
MTGVAIVGAGVIAMTPVAPPLHDVRIAQPVQLSAANDVWAPDQSTLDGAHRNFYNLLPALQTLGLVKISSSGQQLVDFSTTSLSGVLLGLAGPIAAPVFAIGNDLYKAGSEVPAEALATMLNIPVDAVAAFLFGGVHVDVTALVQALGPALGLQFPGGIGVGINFGGLFSPSGSAFNSLDFTLNDLSALGPLGEGIPVGAKLATGNPAGFFGSLGALVQVIANGVNTQVSKFDIPAFGQLFGNVLGAVLNNVFKGLGLGGLTAPGGLLGGLGGLLGLAAPANANVVPASVQKSLAAVTTDSKATASDDASALPAKATRVKTARVAKVDTTAKSSATPPASFGSQVSAAAAGFGASATKGPLTTAKHAKPAASSKAGAGAK